jgi:hypothetical protein
VAPLMSHGANDVMMVHHVVGCEPHHLREPAAHQRESALGDDARLRRAAGARGEQQQVDAALVDRPVGQRGVGVRREGTVEVLGDEHPAGGGAEIEPVEQPHVAGLGHDELAVGVPDVAGQLLPAPRRVDADDDIAGQRRRAQPHRELRDVVEQHAGVRRELRIEGRVEIRGALGARPRVLRPRPRVVLEAQRRMVAVAGPGPDELGDRRHG